MSLAPNANTDVDSPSKSRGWRSIVLWAWKSQFRFLIMISIFNSLILTVLGGIGSILLFHNAVLKTLIEYSVMGFIGGLFGGILIWYAASERT